MFKNRTVIEKTLLLVIGHCRFDSSDVKSNKLTWKACESRVVRMKAPFVLARAPYCGSSGVKGGCEVSKKGEETKGEVLVGAADETTGCNSVGLWRPLA